MSEAAKRRSADPEFQRTISAMWTPERRKEHSEKVRKALAAPDVIAKRLQASGDASLRSRKSRNTRRLWKSAEYRQRVAEGQQKVNALQRRERRSKKIKALWADPDFRQRALSRMLAAQRAKWSDPTIRKREGTKISQRQKLHWAGNQERREQHSKRLKEAYELLRTKGSGHSPASPKPTSRKGGRKPEIDESTTWYLVGLDVENLIPVQFTNDRHSIVDARRRISVSKHLGFDTVAEYHRHYRAYHKNKAQ